MTTDGGPPIRVPRRGERQQSQPLAGVLNWQNAELRTPRLPALITDPTRGARVRCSNRLGESLSHVGWPTTLKWFALTARTHDCWIAHGRLETVLPATPHGNQVVRPREVQRFNKPLT